MKLLSDSYAYLRLVRASALVLLVAFAALIWFVIESGRSGAFKNLSRDLDKSLEVQRQMVERTLSEQRNELRFLYDTPPIQGIARAANNQGTDPHDGTSIAEWKQRLATIFTAYLKTNADVNQVRYIGVANNGLELVRVERDQMSVEVVENAFLQKKGERDYFTETARLPIGQIYTSDINLNREHGKIVFPLEPTYRLAIPIYDRVDSVFGILIINFNAEFLFERMRDTLSSRQYLFLVNSDGGIIVDGYGQHSFGFEQDQASTWHNHYVEFAAGGGATRIVSQEGAELFARARELSVLGVEHHNVLRLIVAIGYDAVDDLMNAQVMGGIYAASGGMLVCLVLLFMYQSNVQQSVKLKEAHANFRALIEGSQDAILTLDESGRITSWNLAAIETLGYSEGQALGKPIDFLFSNDTHQQMFDALFNRVLNNEFTEPLRLPVVRADNQQLEVEVKLSPIKTSVGNVGGVSAFVRDVSVQVQAEQAIRDANKQLEAQVESRTKELARAVDHAKAANAAKSGFIANVSHEIRTPLNGIVGMLRLLHKDLEKQEREKYLSLAEKSAVVLSSLINDVLDLSKIEANKLDIDSSRYCLTTVVDDLVNSLAIKANEQNIDFVLNAAKVKHHYLIGDGKRLRQVLTNLIGNSLKFTESGYVHVSLETEIIEHDKVRVFGVVKDSGIGIAEDKLKAVFGAFAQADSSVTREFGGTGLGLSISRQICQLMGGDIAATSVAGKGSEFSFTLVQRLDPADRNPFQDVSLNGMRALVHTSQEYVSRSLSDYLKVLGVTKIEWPANTKDAAFNAEDYDLVFIDIHLLTDSRVILSEANSIILHKSIMHASKQLKGFENFRKLNKPVTLTDLVDLLRLMQNGGKKAAGMPEIQAQSGASPLQLLKGRAALLVDDNQVNLEIAVGLLADIGMQVITAENGEDALAKLNDPANAFDIILMDCQMPVLDGYETSRLIREGKGGLHNADLPIIAMTANAMAGDKDRCLVAGMSDYLTKPLDPEEFDNMLYRWLKPELK
ncbi:ATP-binding protein [Simiduia sp. 21SJ11W-1]|uniref:ATP-binding protein n=1 Tax=Simiduia sp. 21SJ11W-1 TaxID=2909669 RepID=UPI00209F475F|nr:ATP-binding protein [Simiduia sp. 21SJ11W-1]UTA48213.1 ATP-binding protein [Simiduia sp. 21SJ11W-1]